MHSRAADVTTSRVCSQVNASAMHTHARANDRSETGFSARTVACDVHPRVCLRALKTVPCRESLQIKYTAEKVRVGMRGRINKYLLKSIKVPMLGHQPEFESPAPQKLATNRIYIHFASGREGDP